jgi:hypothetical protein
VSSVINVLGLRVLVVMRRLCIRHSRRSNSRNDKDREDFLQNIVHGANLMGESLTTGCFERIRKCRHSVYQRFLNPVRVNKTCAQSVVYRRHVDFAQNFRLAISSLRSTRFVSSPRIPVSKQAPRGA